MTRLDETYSRPWYREHFGYRHDYEACAEAIDWLFPHGRIVDLGCGIALMAAKLAELGRDVTAYDGSFNARLESPVRIRHIDLREPRPSLGGSYDIVVCTEVAEHMPAEYARQLVETVSSCVPLKGGTILFTAAPPGQGGHDHVNEQPREYWLALFDRHTRQLDKQATALLSDAWAIAAPKMPWLGKNVMVLT